MRPVTIRARGHAHVRARHPKTIELTADTDLTPRGTCIIGVAADLDPARLAGIDGPVVVTLTCGAAVDVVHGVANPRYDATTGRLVIRRSHHRGADTLVVGADSGSADLDRALVAALARDDAELRVDIAADPRPDDAPSTWDADLVAAQAVAQHIGRGAAVMFAGPLPKRATDRRRALAAAPDALTVWQVRPQDVVTAATDAGERLVAVVTDPATPDEVVHDAAPTAPVRARTAFVVVHAQPSAPIGDAALLAALRDAGVPTKTLQDALVRATGISKRDAYARIVDHR